MVTTHAAIVNENKYNPCNAIVGLNSRYDPGMFPAVLR